jgi:hypothetical protein
METLLGVLVVAAGGLIMGSGAWPFKLMKSYRFEHWWFVGMLVGLVVMPWAIMLLGCPGAIENLRDVPAGNLILANVFALAWGIANVLCGLCFVRIGVALTGAILAGLGVSVGVVVPLIFKGSGQFEDAAGIGSPAGLTILAGIAVMMVGVVLAALAGFGRDRALGKSSATSGGFLGGLIMTVIAGVLSAGTAFTFIYGQDEVVSRLSTVRPGDTIEVKIKRPVLFDLGPQPEDPASGKYRVGDDGKIAERVDGKAEGRMLLGFEVGGVRAKDAADRIAARLQPSPASYRPDVSVSTGSIPANFGVWAVGLAAGALVNLGYAAWLLTKNGSWGVILTSGKELALAIVIGVNFSVAVALMGKGMLLLGALGGSIGFGIQQAFQMTGSQGLGFLSGEWRGIRGKPLNLMIAAIAVLLGAAVVLAIANTLAKG